MNFLHEHTCQILTNQGIKSGRGSWPTRDYGEKSERYLSSLLAFLNNWLNLRVRGQFEIKMLIMLGHSDINTTYLIWILKNKLERVIIWKLVTCQRITSKKYSTWMGRHLSPQYGQVIQVSRYLVLTAANWSQDWCAISFLLGSLGSQSSQKVWEYTLVSLWCVRTVGRSVRVRSRDYQIFSDG